MSIIATGTNLSRIMLFLAFIAGIYTIDTGKASAQEVQQCAAEGGICRLPYPTEVIYGAGRRTISRFINSPQIRCSNEVFGDPAKRTAKSCFYVVRDQRRGRDRDYGRNNGRGEQWQHCAREGQYCDFSGRKRVRYGTQNRYVERDMRGGVSCDNRTFGDPDRGAAKSCAILN